MVFLFTTVLLPFLVIALLWIRPRKPWKAWVTTLIMALGVIGFSVLVAPWGVLGLWIRYVILGLFVMAFIVSLRRPLDEERPPENAVRSLVKIAIGFFFGGVALGALMAHAVPAGAMQLALPLRGGSFLVLHGGSRPATNTHAVDPSQQYAVDLVKLGGGMRRASGLSPSDPADFAIWGSEVGSPCSGIVTAAVDGLPDQAPGAVDEKNRQGNHVVIRCGDADVWLAHLQRGSVRVTRGQQVAVGTPLGLVGNSGLSPEPHLHVHAVRNGRAVPILFEGQWLVRNGVIRK